MIESLAKRSFDKLNKRTSFSLAKFKPIQIKQHQAHKAKYKWSKEP